MTRVAKIISGLILTCPLLNFNTTAQILIKAAVPDQTIALGRFWYGHEYLVDTFLLKNGSSILKPNDSFPDGYYTIVFTSSEGGADFIISGDQQFTINISRDLKKVQYRGSEHNECVFNNHLCNSESGPFAEAFKSNTELYKLCSGRPDSLELFFNGFDYSSDFRLHPVFFRYLRSLEIQNEAKFIFMFESILTQLMTDEQKEYLFRYFILNNECGLPAYPCYLLENHIELILDKNSDLYFKLKRRRDKLCE
jgi:hypothetical protein